MAVRAAGQVLGALGVCVAITATGNWGYAEFDYDAASDTFKPLGNDAKCGYACHTIVKAKDYGFTAYPKR